MSKITIYNNYQDIHKYHKYWSSLQRTSEPSTSIEWTEALLISHTAGNEDYFFLIVEENDAVIAFIPLLIRKNHIYGLKIVTITPLSEQYNTHSDIMSDKTHSRTVAKELLDFLAKHFNQWDVFRMSRLLEDNPLYKAMLKLLSDNFTFYRTRYEPPSYYTELPATLDLYLSERSSKFRNHIKRYTKKLSQQGTVDYRAITDNDNFDNVYEDIISIERKSWKHLHGTAISSKPHQTRFYYEFCQRALASNKLHLLIMYINGIPSAYNMGYIENSTYYYLKTSYDDSYRKNNISSILRIHLIDYLVSKNIRYFDFPGEPYQWEQQWANHLRWHKSITLYNKTTTGILLYMLDKGKSLLTRRGKYKELTFCDPKNLQA